MLLALGALVAVAQVPRLGEPFQVTLEDGTAIDIVETGHAGPFYGDVDGDGVPDLLVGEFKGGECRVYHNYGTATEPVFKDFAYLQAGGDMAIVPPY
jgi:hypothetical protein